MKKSLVYLSLACLLVGLLSLVGCSKKENTIEESTPAAGTTEPSTTPMGSDMGTMGTDMGTTPTGTDMGTSTTPMGTDVTPPPSGGK